MRCNKINHSHHHINENGIYYTGQTCDRPSYPWSRLLIEGHIYYIYKAPARSEKIQQKRGEERACVFVGFSNEGWGLSKPNQGFPNRGGQKMGQKCQNFMQLSTAHISGVLEAF